MASPPYLELFRALHTSKVRYAVAGGLAVVLHGVPRMTFDLDLVLDLNDGNMRTLTTVLEREGYEPRLPVPMSELAIAAVRDRWIAERNLIAFSVYHPARAMEEVDLLLVTQPTWDDLVGGIVVRRLADVDVPVVGRSELRAMKLAVGRDKDIADAELLRDTDV